MWCEVIIRKIRITVFEDGMVMQNIWDKIFMKIYSRTVDSTRCKLQIRWTDAVRELIGTRDISEEDAQERIVIRCKGTILCTEMM